MPSVDRVLTTATIEWTATMSEAVRIVDWSPGGRLLSVSADGTALVEHPHRTTSPMTPDPRDAVWLGERAVAVVDPLCGLVTAGFDRDRPVEFAGARHVGTHGGRTVVAGDGRIAVFGHLGLDHVPEVIWTGVGVTHACRHIGGSLWALGGTGGLALVDVALGCVDTRLELPGVIAISSCADAGRLVVSDLAGVLHVLELRDLGNGVELTGYCDPVRHVSLEPGGHLVVAAAADEITRWAICADGTIAERPTCVLGHDAAITALAHASTGVLATGDEHGVVHLWSTHLAEYPVATLRLDGEVTSIAWTSDGGRLACGSVAGELLVADVRPGGLA